MKNGQKLKLGDTHFTPRNIQEVQASKLGDAPEEPLHRQKSGHLSRHYIFIASYSMRSFLERQLFSLSVLFLFCLPQYMVGSYHVLFGGDEIRFFIAKNTLVFTLIVQRVFSFSATAFSFRFSPSLLFRSCYIFASRCIYTTGLCWFSSKELFQKDLNGVGKEKKFHGKRWYKKELV
jgi:hypothetical protein